jgi:hypothetical protein
VPDDLKEEFAIPALESNLIMGERTLWNTTKHEWTAMKSRFLFAGVTLFANRLDGFQLFEAAF